LLADDHKLVGAGIRSLLQRLPDIEVVAEASDGRETLRLIEEHRPQIVLMDIGMPELNGLEATRRLANTLPEVSVIMEFVQRTDGHPRSTNRLSPRQTEVLQFIAEGKSMKQIALGLSISVKTVETHRAAVMTRIGVRDIAGLVRYAVKIVLIDLT
jgi:DNA-binding NarL/FixJ family response regulator